MKILNIIGKEVFDSRGFPTIECEIHLEDGFIARASVPTGASKSKYEAFELRDGGERLFGNGVLKAVDSIDKVIAPHFLGKKINAVEMDLEMIQLDGTADKSKLGANAILAVSMALYRAHAYAAQTELFNFIGLVFDSDTVTLPVPMINFINGGTHADNNLLIQEYLVIPYGAPNIRLAIECSIVLFNTLKDILQENGKATSVGDEGGFAPKFANEGEPFDYILKAIKKSELDPDMFCLGVDVAASQYYDLDSGLYTFNGIQKTTNEMISWNKSLVKKYNLFSVEDGLSQDDWGGWIKLNDKLGDDIHIIADDLFATNPERILKGIEFGACNSVVIKPNQIGTITETLQSIQICKDNGLSTIVSHRSGETNDTFIVDLSVGASTNYLKCGGLTHSERMEKYNRLLEIENLLTSIIL